ncbi:MAG: 2Fe-2S iron-sulfur cluster-binding protein [Chromatiaceae bacterium]|nr:2Fe-2S iron-sulfur cluster-binding protein [Candidatus Thioaporhodococcus sediminis]
MTQLLSLSRSARLAGVTRAEIQRRIRRGELTTFEGEIAVSDLLRVFPQVSLDNDDALERVQRIKAMALPRSHDADTVLPSPEVLRSRLKGMGEALAAKVSALDAAHTLLDDVEARLAQLGQAPTQAGLQADIRELADWLAQSRQALTDRTTLDREAQLLAKDNFLRLMAASVKLIPSGRDFFVEGDESILEASVRAGLHLAYGCASGNCGACKARVVSGEVRKIRDHDYPLSTREKEMGYMLACSNTAVTDLVLEAAEALSVDDIPPQEIRATLQGKEMLDGDLISLHLQTPRTQTLRFMAGQRALLTLEDDSAAELPIASCPCDARNLRFLVRRRPDRPFAAAIFGDQVRPGHLVLIQGPVGRFVLDETATAPAVFVAFGEGIAPMRGLIEHGISLDTIESFHLYWQAPGDASPLSLEQGRWCRALQDALDNFTLTPLPHADTQEILARLLADHPEPGGRRFYLAGPRSRIEPLAEALRNHDVAADRLSMEFLED